VRGLFGTFRPRETEGILIRPSSTSGSDGEQHVKIAAKCIGAGFCIGPLAFYKVKENATA
jgi:hypothetical protein